MFLYLSYQALLSMQGHLRGGRRGGVEEGGGLKRGGRRGGGRGGSVSELPCAATHVYTRGGKLNARERGGC